MTSCARFITCKAKALNKRALAALLVFLVAAAIAEACPFCTALKPSFAQRRERAACVAFAEIGERTTEAQSFTVHQSSRSTLDRGDVLAIPNNRFAPGVNDLLQKTEKGLVVLMAEAPNDTSAPRNDSQAFDPAAFTWDAIVVDELAYAYFAKAPTTTEPIAERLKYFAKFIEHPNALVAEDVYFEFGQASYEAVRDAASLVPEEKLRAWLVDPAVRPERKGMLALMLGTKAARGESPQGAALLKKLVLAPSTDFRAGYDGTLGAYLVAEGERGLELIENHLLKNPDAGPGDLRHAASALRFYHEYERAIPRDRIAKAAAHLLDRVEVASIAIVDLARWQYWDALPRILKFTAAGSTADRQTTRSAIGFLLVCPLPAAKTELARLRQTSPALVRDVEQNLGVLGDQS